MYYIKSIFFVGTSLTLINSGCGGGGGGSPISGGPVSSSANVALTMLRTTGTTPQVPNPNNTVKSASNVSKGYATFAPSTVPAGTLATATVAPTTQAARTVPVVTAATATVAPTTVAARTVAARTVPAGTVATATVAPTTQAARTFFAVTVAPTTIAATTVAPAAVVVGGHIFIDAEPRPIINDRCRADNSFHERFFVEGEGDIPHRVEVPVAPPQTREAIHRIGTSHAGIWFEAKRNVGGHELEDFERRLARSIRNHPVTVAEEEADFYGFWHANKGPEFMEYIELLRIGEVEGRCGESGRMYTTSRINCFTFMMLATNVPVPAGMKPRHVARALGLDQFCINNDQGLLEELNSRVNEVTIANHDDLNLSNEEKLSFAVRDGFAANWLAFCPNLIESSSSSRHDGEILRQMVFKHGVYRTQILKGQRRDNMNLAVHVPRETLFSDSMEAHAGLLGGNYNTQLLWPITFAQFVGENGIGPGVLTNYYDEMSLQIFGPVAGLFDFQNQNSYVRLRRGLLANARTSGTHAQVVAKLRAAGRFLGHVICANRRLSVDLSVMFLARLLGKIIGFEALHHYEPQIKGYYENAHNNGESSYVPIPDQIPQAEQPDEWPVNQHDRDYLLDLAVSNFVTYDVEEEYNEFTAGLFEIIPQSVFESGITTSDLNLLIFGQPDVDVDDMVANWVLTNFDMARNPLQRQTIEWLESIVREWDQIHRRKFVQFVTGTPTVPPGGFASYRNIGNRYPFTIENFNYRVDLIPSTHNCFNRIDLGSFTSREEMKRLLELGLTFGDGFGAV